LNKLFAVLKREYIQAVRKKMFIIMTFLLPVLMSALFILPSLLMVKGMGQKRVAVLDGTGQLQPAFAQPNAPTTQEKQEAKRPIPRRRSIPTTMTVEYVNRAGDENLEETAKPYMARLSKKQQDGGLDGVLLIPSAAIASAEGRLKYYARSATDFVTQERLASITNGAVQRIRLTAQGIQEENIDRIMTDMRIDAVQLSKSGQQKKGGVGNFLIGFLFIALLIMPSLIYGLEIMRGIIQEKTDRVAEILVSSMTPVQLLVGKIVGIAAVGLTQISVWMIMAGVVGAYAGATTVMAGGSISQFLSAATFLYFFIFFILAYLTFVCIYAIGGAVCNSEKEANQLIAPVTMVMLLPWFLMAAIITNPDSPLSVGFSLSPVFAPITMFVRILVADPPLWHIAVAILVSIATIAVFFWVTAKIFRVGILAYGKRPTIPELWRWLKVA
jgi:ABC-2 type transport system permease protein